jgi:hypothetical protein
LAVVLADRGDACVAARLLGFVTSFYARYGNSPEPTEAIVEGRLRDFLRRRLDDATLQREIAAGELLTQEQACAIALEASEGP